MQYYDPNEHEPEYDPLPGYPTGPIQPKPPPPRNRRDPNQPKPVPPPAPTPEVPAPVIPAPIPPPVDYGGGGGDVGGGGIFIDPSYLAPFTGKAPDRGMVPTFNAPLGNYQAPAFVAPTGASLLQDPGVQFRLDEGRGMLENSAAAKGTLNSGGTLYDILNYGQKAASQEYANKWDRDFGLWNAQNQSAQSAWNENWNHARSQFDAELGASDSAYSRAWQQYVDAKDTWYRNQNEPYTKLFQAASLGASTAR